jgi:signal transduction histidine kinase
VRLDLHVIEVAAYFVVSEMLANAAKHAQASVITVQAITRDRRLEVLVADDGRGGADPTCGSGLFGLIDRVDALGGRSELASPPGEGTSLRIRLPLDSA